MNVKTLKRLLKNYEDSEEILIQAENGLTVNARLKVILKDKMKPLDHSLKNREALIVTW